MSASSPDHRTDFLQTAEGNDVFVIEEARRSEREPYPLLKRLSLFKAREMERQNRFNDLTIQCFNAAKRSVARAQTTLIGAFAIKRVCEHFVHGFNRDG